MYEELIDSSDSEFEDFNIPRFQKGPGPDKIINIEKPELIKSASTLRLEMLCRKTSKKTNQ